MKNDPKISVGAQRETKIDGRSSLGSLRREVEKLGGVMRCVTMENDSVKDMPECVVRDFTLTSNRSEESKLEDLRSISVILQKRS